MFEDKNKRMSYKKERFTKTSLLAGVQGFEPRSTDPESVVLPLNDTPLCFAAAFFGLQKYDTPTIAICQAFFEKC